MTETHNSSACERGETGARCEMCEWADEQERAQLLDTTAKEIAQSHPELGTCDHGNVLGLFCEGCRFERY